MTDELPAEVFDRHKKAEEELLITQTKPVDKCALCTPTFCVCGKSWPQDSTGL